MKSLRIILNQTLSLTQGLRLQSLGAALQAATVGAVLGVLQWLVG